MKELRTVDTIRELYSNKIIKLEVIDASICDRKIKQTIIV